METNQDISNDPPLRKGGSRVRRYKPHSKRGCNTCKQVVRFPTEAMANGITTESDESSVGRSDLPVCVARERGGHVMGTSMDPMPDLTPQHPVQEVFHHPIKTLP